MIHSALVRRVAQWVRRHAAADRNSLTITIAPAQAERTFQVDLPRWSVRLLFAALIASFVLMLAGGVLYGKLIRDAVLLRDLRKENQILRARADRVDSLEVVIGRIDRIRAQLYNLAGVPDANAADTARVSEDAEMSISSGWDEQAHTEDLDPSAIESPIRSMPLRGPISRGFSAGSTRMPEHPGVDIAGAQGSPVAVAGDGVVASVTWDGTYGNLLVVDHGSGWITRYGHSQTVIVQQGDTVRNGQTVALVGSTGKSSAPHVHFEISRDGEAVDPGRLFPSYRVGMSGGEGGGRTNGEHSSKR